MLHVSPEADSGREILPHSLVLPYTLLTFVNKRLQTVLLNLILSVQAESLLNFQLYRQAVGIPARFSGNHITFHCTVSGDHILDNTGQDMTNVGFSVCSRRAVVENIFRTSLTLFDTLLEDVVLLPELLHFLLPADKIHICWDFLIHVDFPFFRWPAGVLCPLRAQFFSE